MKITILLLLVSWNVQADEAEECLDESVETAVSVKIAAIANGDCSSIDKESFMSFEEDRLNKRRFLKQAKAALAKGETIPASMFEDIDEKGSGKMLDKTNICAFLKEKNLAAIKKYVMQDCSHKDGAQMYQWSLKKSGLADYSLAHVCPKVDEMKTQACKDAKITYEMMDADKKKKMTPPVINPSSSGAGAKANAQ